MSRRFNLVVFATGALVGSVATFQLMKKKYEQIVQEEIQSVKESFTNLHKCEKKECKNPCEMNDKTYGKSDELHVYREKVIKEKYTSYQEETKPDKDQESEYRHYYPFVISPESFGEHVGFKMVSLTLYADGKLTTESGELVNVDATVGEDYINHFGDYEDDAVHIRNIDLETDYEILLDPRNYSEVYKKYNN